MENNPIITVSNQRILDSIRLRNEKLVKDPLIFFPWWNPCKVRVLLVTDGGLDFGDGDFGLSTFVSILQNDGRSYVKFDITLGHISSTVTDAQVMKGAPGIVKSIKGFRFDDPTHFTPQMYDQIWLFGISSSYGGGRLTAQELNNINLFMNNGGGVFATGDHGTLGNALCGSIPRVRSMRLWSNTAFDNNLNEVSMNGTRRNDTNRRGSDGVWQFDDQSDDVPQEIQPKLYTSHLSPFFKETYPHPLLCSRFGRINHMPDHPHEGECIEPSDLTQNDLLGNLEYPFGISGQIKPEVIAHSSVLAGSGDGASKALTQAHSFGSICAYDGHLAGVGRVVTDATWHHFVNVNLVGELGEPDPVKSQGFLASAQGMTAFDKIKEYYINIGVWISPTHLQTCFNTKLIWPLIAHHRVIEASVIDPSQKLSQMSIYSLYGIGTHATDVLGKKASQCRKLQWFIDIFKVVMPEMAVMIDPWTPIIKNRRDSLPMVDPMPILNVAIGAGLVALRDEIGEINSAIDAKTAQKIQKVFEFGVKTGSAMALKAFNDDLNFWSKIEIAEDAYVVKGFVTDKDGEPLAGLTVKAVDQDFTNENALGAATTTDKTGYFRIPYKASDFIIDGKESGGADIILYISKGDKLVFKTDTYRNAPNVLSVNIIVNAK